MKKRLLALLVTALVLCTIAVTVFADYTSDWITTQTYVEIPLGTSGLDSSEGLTISVTISAPNGTSDNPVGARGYAYYSTPVVEDWQYFGGVQVESWDETDVFHNFIITLPPYNSGSNAVVGIDISDIVPILNNDIRWRYTITPTGIDTTGSYEEGYNAGYSAGDTAGYNRGYTEGYNAGLTSGGNSGTYQEGYNAGYELGYSAGDTIGYERGYNIGYTEGLADADPQGEYAQGFADGKAQGQDDANLVGVALNGFFDSLVGFIEPFTNIGIGTLTIGSMLAIMVITMIVYIIVKVVRG